MICLSAHLYTLRGHRLAPSAPSTSIGVAVGVVIFLVAAIISLRSGPKIAI